MPIPRPLLIGALGFLAGLAPAWAQSELAALRGQVTDPAGASIPGAVVSANTGNGISRSATADVRGQYVLANLPPGAYTVRASAKGFEPMVRTGIGVGPGNTLTIDFPLSLAAANQSVTVSDTGQSVQVDPTSNADALVMRGKDLDALSDDPDDLAADLAALAGPGAGPNGGQIYIDGFTGGRLPAKSSIREVRINQNPFSAQYDRIGMGRVEVLTKPGSDDFHGEIQTHDGSDIFNARNPFLPEKPTWQRLGVEGEVSGPIGKKTSFFVDYEVRKWTENTFVNAVTLDKNLEPLHVSQAVLTPRRDTEDNVKLDCDGWERPLEHRRTSGGHPATAGAGDSPQIGLFRRWYSVLFVIAGLLTFGSSPAGLPPFLPPGSPGPI